MRNCDIYSLLGKIKIRNHIKSTAVKQIEASAKKFRIQHNLIKLVKLNTLREQSELSLP